MTPTTTEGRTRAVIEQRRNEFFALLWGWRLTRYTDGGATEVGRHKRREVGKRQRQARKATR